MQQDHGGFPLRALGLLHRAHNLIGVVAVDRLHMPAEGSPFVLQRLERIDLLRIAVDLHFIVIGKGDERIEAPSARKHGGLPNLALVTFAVADDGINRIRQMVHLNRERHSDRGGKALPQRTGGHIDADGAPHIAVAGEHGAGAVQGIEKLYREIALQRQRGIQGRAAERQTVLFSATLSGEIKTIAAQYQQNTKQICIQPNTASAKKVEQFYCEVRGNAKFSALVQLLQKKQFDLSLVFVATKVMAGDLASQLTEAGYPAEAIHGDLRQKQRDQVMRRYRDGKVSILVATDVAARGIDVGGIDAVVNYDIPSDAESYVHRIGRTGRADCTGVAYTFIYPRERGKLHGIISNTKATIAPVVLDAKAALPEFSMLQKQYKNESQNKRRNTGKPWNKSRSPRRQAVRA